MKRAIVVGSGAGGATAAKELQGHYQITVLEAGKAFRPLSTNLSWLENLRKTGLFFDEREIQLLFPAMRIRKTREKMVLVNGIGTGGTTTIATGNALRMDGDLKKLGIDLDPEFGELYAEIPITTGHQQRWQPITRRLFDICETMDLNPQPTPKMGNYDRCIQCGRCMLGCPRGAKWDSRQFLKGALAQGAQLVTGCSVEKIVINENHASGVIAKCGWRRQFFPADLIVIAAGGFGTPVVLQNSGIPCEPNLFVDPVLCVATEWKDCRMNEEIPMPFVIQKQHFMLSPYFDYLSFFFNRQWRIPAQHILALMIKLADDNQGTIHGQKIDKELTGNDRDHLRQGVEDCTEILTRLGAQKKDIFLGTINAGHPGGMLPLTADESASFHSPKLPENVYVADATLFPDSLGNPPILTIMALAKRISKICRVNIL